MTPPSALQTPRLMLVIPATFLYSVTATGSSPQSHQIQQQLAEVGRHASVPASYRLDSLRERFRTLSQKWRSETQLLSSTTESAMHPAYQEIIGMGAAALPLILEDLRQNSGHWYWALKAISGEDPVVPADRGSIKKMKAAWLRWGKTKGHFNG
jgi:hypothetical protein